MAKESSWSMSRMAGVWKRKVVQHDFYDAAGQVAAVVLMNSPSNGRWEYEEYLRLLRVRRFNKQQPESSVGRCYFLCTDGAFSRLQAYIEEERKHRPELRPFSHVPFCDAVIGDMDSCKNPPHNYGTHGSVDGAGFSLSAPTEGYATVDDIPTSVLDQIHDRYTFTVAEFTRMSATMEGASLEEWDKLDAKGRDELLSLPFWLYVRCQSTTDFMKALILLNRLREKHKEDIVSIPPHVLRTESGKRLLETGGAIIPNAGSIGLDLDPERERELCAEACKEEAVLLPTYVCMGALGGRFDQEMASISVMLSASTRAHVVLINSNNTIFACQFNGWTQFVRNARCEGVTCGLINYGTMKECETSGLQWNIAVGRGKPSESKDLVLGFGKLISACNSIRREVVTIDLRRQLLSTRSQGGSNTKQAPANERDDEVNEDHNPPTIFSIERCDGDETKFGHSC
ncbi:hypothetical protein C4B63_170g16 [Trypanosoma cruzi]|uniref:Thiamin pyrophosphokinase thiamin-binding domain-containing protein n=1 Tax=Trypanosoma cruzi TaxID=5693 RepID=A0A2V2UMH1_TRYCR|nr:hypothetical protein C4B63_170g16 [Trypanosoma cruzi]